jgi:predicted phage-related endonuclease
MPKPINISASRGAAVLGLSKWQTPVEVWLQITESIEPGFCEKRKYELPEFEYSSVMKWGHAFESSIIELAENQINWKIIDREKYFIKNRYITCHVDGIYDFGRSKEYRDGDLYLHEGKTTNFRSFREEWGEPGTDQVPIIYQIQCQHQMICTGAEKVILSVLVFPKMVDEWENEGWEVKTIFSKDMEEEFFLINSDKFKQTNPLNWAKILDEQGYFHQYEITANKELQKLMIEKYTDFWNNHVFTGIPPEAKNYDDIKKLVREPVGTIIADERIELLMNEYKQIRHEISPTGLLSKRCDQIRLEILKFMDKSENVQDDDSKDRYILRDRTGRKIASYSRNKNGTFIFR